MSKPVTLRLPEETARRLEAVARRAGRSVSETGARSIEEWLRQNEFPEIEFRDFQGQRLACLKGSIRIWKIIFTAQDYDFDVEKTAAHFQFPVHRIEAAFAYYRAYPEEADRIIADNRSWTYEKLKQVLPQLGRFTVHLDPNDDELVIS
ncbi:MAG: ribbon-helix-helix protein, CopG family [Chloroflexota bacterium]